MSSTDTCAWNDTICQQQDETVVIARLSERDFVYPVGIDQVYLPGISLNKMGHDVEYYLRNALDIGFRAIFLDLEWYSSQWNLNGYTVQEVCTVLQDYINRTDTNLEVSLLRLGIRFRAQNLTLADQAALNSSDFVSAISPITSRLFTPQNLTQMQSAGQVSSEGVNRSTNLWPSLTHILLESKQRIFVSVERDLPANVSYSPLAGLAFDSVPWPVETASTEDLESIPFRSLSINSLDNYDKYCGYSPVWNGSITNSTLSSLGSLLQWTWQPNQPTVETSAQRSHLLDNQNYSMCAAQSATGLFVDNCYKERKTLCRNVADPLKWILTSQECTFFNSDDCCPNDYAFGTPKTILESIAARNALGNVSAGWVAANSLVVSNCWVNSTSSYCPYSIAEGNRNGIAQLVVIGSVGLFLFVAIIALEYRHQRMPLRPALRGKKKKQE